jgi:hypothetical protein
MTVLDDLLEDGPFLLPLLQPSLDDG